MIDKGHNWNTELTSSRWASITLVILACESFLAETPFDFQNFGISQVRLVEDDFEGEI